MRYVLPQHDGWKLLPYAAIWVPPNAKGLLRDGDIEGARLEEGAYSMLDLPEAGGVIQVHCPWDNTKIRIRTLAEAWEIQVTVGNNYHFGRLGHIL
jgi:hypothetical protein